MFIAVAITWIAGFGLCGLATARALWLSLRFHIKLWLGPQAHQARRQNHWPPYGAGTAINRAVLLVLTTLFVIYIPATFAILIAGPGRIQPEMATAIFFAVAFLGLILMLVVRDVMVKRVVARSPAECWNDGEIQAPDSPATRYSEVQ